MWWGVLTFVRYCVYIYIYTLTCHFIRYILLVPGWTPFVFRTALILRLIDSTRCWKHFSEMLLHIDMISSRSCCRFVDCTSMMWISRSTTSQRCSIGLRSGDCGVKWTHCHVQETSLRWFELCVMMHYPAGSTSEDGYTNHKGMDVVSNNTQVGV